MSLGEVYDVVEAYNKRREQDFKNAVRMQFLQAELVTRYLTLGKNDSPPQPWDYYPKLFEQDKKAYEESIKEKEMEQFKERRRQYIAAVNQRRRGM